MDQEDLHRTRFEQEFSAMLLSPFTVSVGTVIRAWRNYRGFTQQKLGDLTGLKKGYISQIESDKVKRTSDENLKKLANALGIRPLDLLTRRQPPTWPVQTLSTIAPQTMASATRIPTEDGSANTAEVPEFRSPLDSAPSLTMPITYSTVLLTKSELLQLIKPIIDELVLLVHRMKEPQELQTAQVLLLAIPDLFRGFMRQLISRRNELGAGAQAGYPAPYEPVIGEAEQPALVNDDEGRASNRLFDRIPAGIPETPEETRKYDEDKQFYYDYLDNYLDNSWDQNQAAD